MAERRIQRSGRRGEPNSEENDQTRENKAVTKRRSRSEGSRGRRRIRNSVQEGNKESVEFSKPQQSRYSMFTGPLSDDDISLGIPGSDSSDSDDRVRKQWTKSPLHVKRTKRTEKNGKQPCRKSVHNTENGFLHYDNLEKEANVHCTARSKSPQVLSCNKNRDSFVHQENGGNAVASNMQKGKFQKLEERRNKRIDIAVTSDEECTPQSRISRLRQRAILSSNLFANKKPLEDNDIFPQTSYRSFEQPDIPTEYIGRNKLLKSSGYQEEPNRFKPINLQHENGSVKSNGVNNYISIGSGRFHDIKQQGIAKGSQQVASSRSNDVQGFPFGADKGSARGGIVELPQGGILNYWNTSESKESVSSINEDSSHKGKENISEIQMRSFREVKSNNPPKAVNKIKLHRRYPDSDSSDDSLDDLIESNIQYLESEIESGRLKHQSSHYVSQVLDSKLTKSGPQDHKPIVSSSVQDKIRFRLQVPSNASNQTARFRGDSLSQSVPNVTRVSNRQPILSQSVYMTTHKESLSQDPGLRTMQSIPNSCSSQMQNTIPKVICSPYFQRRSVVLPEMEDLSKSDSHLNASQTNEIPSLHSYSHIYTNVSQADTTIVSQPLQSHSLLAVEGGMFSDVEYDIEVSERVKKWEKLMKQKFDHNCSESQRTLNTIQESEIYTSDSSQQNIQDKQQHFHQPSKQKVSMISVNLTKSTSSGSHVSRSEPAILSYSEPRVVASETNLHRIFRVISERAPTGVVKPSDSCEVNGRSLSLGSMHPLEKSSKLEQKRKSEHPQISTNMKKLSGNEETLEAKPPIATDSDGGVRKSWRTSRYDEELSELKEIVSDSFQDLKKKFDSDASENEVKRSPSPVRQIPKYVKERWDKGPVFPQPFSVIETISPKAISPAVSRRNESDLFQSTVMTLPTQSVSGSIPLSPTKRALLSAMRSDFETHTVYPYQAKEEMASLNNFLSGLESKVKVKEAEVWSPSMESSRGLISIERMKARTLQTIPFSEDPVWKEIEEMTSFGKEALLADKFASNKIEDLDALLQTESSESMFHSQCESADSDSRYLQNAKTSNNRDLKSETQAQAFRARAFQTPNIQPLRLKIFTHQLSSNEKSSASALDEVLEDIRASLHRKPLSPKTKKNFESSGSSPSIISPDLQHSTKQFAEHLVSKPKISLSSKVITSKNNEQVVDHIRPIVLEENELTGQEKFEQQLKEAMQAPFIDPQYTQFPYLINGNYHLDPSLLKQKLISTGLAADSSDESVVSLLNGSLAADKKVFAECLDHSKELSANQTRTLQIQDQSVSQTKLDASDLDHSVEELKGLAREVEFKLSQIKSRIVKADEDRLDSILRALRKFAPSVEQKYFDVKFSPIDSGKVKKSKLNDALTELERIYESLDLNDDSLIDGADRRDYVRSSNQSSSNIRNVKRNKEGSEHSVHTGKKRSTSGFNEDIAEVERQTQGEFEDITKAFQILLEDVTTQCKAVLSNASSHDTHGHTVLSEPIKEIQMPIEIKVQPQVTFFKLGRVITDLKKDNSENQHGTQLRGKEHTRDLSSLYASFDKPFRLSSSSQTTQSESSTQKAEAIDRAEHKVITQVPASVNKSIKHIDTHIDTPTELQTQPDLSKHSAVGKVVDKLNAMTSVDSAGLKSSGLGSTAKQMAVDMGIQADSEVVSSIKSKQTQSSRGAGRFQRRGNMEHRKSMPADVLKRNIETQTVETQTTFSPVRDQFESKLKGDSTGSSVTECSVSSDSSPDVQIPRKRKISKGIASRIVLFSSSDDEHGKLSRLRRSQSAPSLIELIHNDRSETKCINADKTCMKLSKRKSATPRHIKQRNNESKIGQKHHIVTNDGQVEKGSESTTSSITSDDIQSSPLNKPPLYPIKPTKSEKDSPKRLDCKFFSFDRDSNRTQRGIAEQSCMSDGEIRKPRRKSEGHDNELVDKCERPRSFHELVAMFESNPDKLKKIKRLRKCASAESMITETILRKTFRSDSGLFQDGNNGDSGMILTLELQTSS